MSAHSEIVRDYVELRNYLAQSHPQANMEFEIHFKIQAGSIGSALLPPSLDSMLAAHRAAGFPDIVSGNEKHQK